MRCLVDNHRPSFPIWPPECRQDPAAESDAILANRIRWIHLAELADQGMRVGRKRVARLRQAGGKDLGDLGPRSVMRRPSLGARMLIAQPGPHRHGDPPPAKRIC